MTGYYTATHPLSKTLFYEGTL